MTVAELFFGRDIPGRAPLSDAEWSDFAANIVAAEFPDGFTVYDGEGQWRDPQTHKIVRERTKILIVAAPVSAETDRKLAVVADDYKRRFKQLSVGIVTSQGCGSF
jgi:hypothetical protein